jgi:hypothetical protein
MAFFFLMVVFMALVIAPVVIFTVTRIVPRVVDRTVPPIVDRFAAGTSPEIEARLTRIEEAIDAMAIEIERLRTGELPAAKAAPARLSGLSDVGDARD